MRKLDHSLAVGFLLMLGIGVTIHAGATQTLSTPYGILQEGQSQVTAPHQKTTNSGRKSGIIRQTTDLTCGPAAVASLLKFYFGEETSEDEMARLSGTYEKGTSTLLGLRKACRAKGYEATGYRMSFSELIREVEASGVPVLVHFKEPTFHYALVLGRVDDFVLVSDPSQGNVSMHVDDFIRRWDKNTLVVKSGRPVDSARIERRKRATATRLGTLDRAATLMSVPRF